ncbi:MAG: hypothetical protein ACK47R_06465, partial [Planctomycetia bacterium]
KYSKVRCHVESSMVLPVFGQITVKTDTRAIVGLKAEYLANINLGIPGRRTLQKMEKERK